MGDNQAADEVDFIREGEGGSRAALPAVSSTRPSSAAVTDTDDSGVSSRPFSSGYLLPPQLPPTTKNQPALPWNKVYKFYKPNIIYSFENCPILLLRVG